MIIDAHAHIAGVINGETGSGPTRSLRHGMIRWGSRDFQLLPPLAETTSFPPEVLLAYMDSVGVDRAVLLQGGFYGDSNAYVADAVARWPERFVGAGFLDPCARDAEKAFERCLDDFGFRILKFEMSVATGLVGLYPALRLDGPEMSWIWDECERREIVVTLDLGAVGCASYQTAALEKILDKRPRLRVVIAHLGQPPIGRPDARQLDALWYEQVTLGLRDNVWFDLSALPGYASRFEEYPYPSVEPYIQSALELVGPSKLMWGTDVPGLLTSATYAQLREVAPWHLTGLDSDQLALVLGGTAAEVYFREWDLSGRPDDPRSREAQPE